MEIKGDFKVHGGVDLKISCPKYAIVDVEKRLITSLFFRDTIEVNFDHTSRRFYSVNDNVYIDMPKDFYDRCYRTFIKDFSEDFKKDLETFGKECVDNLESSKKLVAIDEFVKKLDTIVANNKCEFIKSANNVMDNLKFELREGYRVEYFKYKLFEFVIDRLYDTAEGFIQDCIGDDDILDNYKLKCDLIEALDDYVVSKI